MKTAEFNVSGNIPEQESLDTRLSEIAEFLTSSERMGKQFNVDTAREYFDELQFLAKKISGKGKEPRKYSFKFHGREFSFADLLNKLRTLIDKYEEEENNEDSLVANEKYHFDFKTVENILSTESRSVTLDQIHYIEDSIKQAKGVLDDKDPVKGFADVNPRYNIENLNTYIHRMEFWLLNHRNILQ